MSRRFHLRVTIAVDVDNPQLARLTAPDRATFVRGQVQNVIDSDDVRAAFGTSEIKLIDATAIECRETRSQS